MSWVWGLVGAGSARTRGKNTDDGRTEPERARGRAGVRAGPPLVLKAGLGPHTVPGPQDVRYLHFLEGTRDYEWLEAMFLNQSLVKTSLSWFRYPRPPLLPHPPAPPRSCVWSGSEGGWAGGDSLRCHLEMGYRVP